jgi:hypothetical protein
MSKLRRRFTALSVAAVSALAAVSLIAPAGASATSGYFCGTPSAPYTITSYPNGSWNCVHGAYHSQYTGITASQTDGLSPSQYNICAGNSYDKTTNGTPFGIAACSNHTYAAGGGACTTPSMCVGYAWIENYSGGRTVHMYGWLNYV